MQRLYLLRQFAAAFCFAYLIQPAHAWAKSSTNPDVLVRRGSMKIGTGKNLPKITMASPAGGWTASPMLNIKGNCSDPTADPIRVSINGCRYYMRSNNGNFSRKFPASPGKNNLLIECVNQAGTGRFERIVTAATPPTRMQLVLTSDTDGVYTDLHIYEPDGSHVYWAQTNSPTGGLFYLNNEGESIDLPGFGPYVYSHPLPPLGTFRVDTNYWPGGAIQHTLANLEIIIDQGLPTEQRRRVQKPLSMPGETQTLAYITILPNRSPPKIFVPGVSPESERPPEVPKKPDSSGYDDASNNPKQIPPDDELRARESIVALALQQSRKISRAWDPAQRDCAGLVRFAYREALRQRTVAQRNRLEVPDQLSLPPLSGWGQRISGNGAKIWVAGYYPDGKKILSEFVSAEALIAHNFKHRSWRVDDAQTGDVLVFSRPNRGENVFHLMLVANEGARSGSVVYHNGEKGKNGQVRVVAMRELFESADVNWRPDRSNTSFLGVFAWEKFKGSSLNEKKRS